MNIHSSSSYNLENWALLNESQKLQITINLLQKPFEERAQDDLDLLVKCTENIAFFQELGTKVHRECCQYLTFSSAEKDDVLIKEGDLGTTFYIIIMGSVGVYRYTNKQDLEADKQTLLSILPNFEQPADTRPSVSSISKLDEPHVGVPEPTKETFQTIDKFKLREHVHTIAMSLTLINGATRKKEEKILSLKSTLPAGNSFGERALMSNARRKATIIAHEHTYFACLERQYFNLTLKEREKKVHTENINFLQSQKYFKTFSYYLLEQIYYLAKRQKFSKGQVVFSEGDAPESVYIIRSGQFKLLKAIEIKSDPDAYSQVSEITNGLMKRKMIRKNGEIAILSAGEFFGEHEAVQNIPRTCSIICESPLAELYILPRNLFISSIHTDANFKLFMEQQRKLRANLHQHRLELITGIKNQNKTARGSLTSGAKPSSSGSYFFPSPKDQYFEKTERPGRPTDRSVDRSSFDDFNSENKNSFFKESTGTASQRIKETLYTINKNLLNEGKTRSPAESRKSFQVQPIPTSGQRLSIFTQNVSPKPNLTRKARHSFASPTAAVTTLKNPKETKNQIVISKVDDYRLEESPLFKSPSDPVRKSFRSHTAHPTEILPAVSLIKPKTLAPGLLSPSVLDQRLKKKYSSPDSRALKTTTRHETSKDQSDFRPSVEIGDNATLESPMLSMRKSFIAKFAQFHKMSGELEIPKQPSVISSSADLAHNNNFVSFAGAKILANSPEGKSLNASPKLQPQKRSLMIGPLKKQMFLKEAHKTKEFMMFKFTGKV